MALVALGKKSHNRVGCNIAKSYLTTHFYQALLGDGLKEKMIHGEDSGVCLYGSQLASIRIHLDCLKGCQASQRGNPERIYRN